MFSPELREGVAAGDITVSVRLWQRAKVKAGGRYASHGCTIEVDSVELLPFSPPPQRAARLHPPPQ